jgi:hypothetical protein
MTSTVVTAALIGALTILPAPAAQTDFTGTWVLDTSRSEGVPEGMEQTMTVKQSGDRIEIETHSRTPMGERRVPDVYVLDGRETDFQPVLNVEASATGMRTSRWSEGRNAFEATERATVQGPDGEITVTAVRRWTLSPDGETLTIELTNRGPQGEMTSTRVFTRQGGSALDAAGRALAVESVASIVERNYPWPDTAQAIADHVRRRHASNAYDTISTLGHLARALTGDLRAINGDLHLGVSGGPSMVPSGPATGSPGDRPTGIERFERLDGNVGYLKFNVFAGNWAFDAVAQALASLDGTDAVILDLRGVPGGTAQMSRFLISHFMPPEVHYLNVVSMATGERTAHETLSDVPGPRRLNVPLYVLVDRRSGSAAEAVPFVLQHFGRATIVGERTAGAGRNVGQFPAELGLSVSLSTTRVYEPASGREWERTGVLPDIVTTSDEALTTALEHARGLRSLPDTRIPQSNTNSGTNSAQVLGRESLA